MTFQKWWETGTITWPMPDSRIALAWEAWQESAKQKRETCEEIAESFCHCSEAYTGRNLIDPTCDCHDIAAAIRERADDV